MARDTSTPRPVAEPRWRLAARHAVADGVPARSLRVALVVGTLLNLINQGDALFGAAPVNWWKLLPSFAMPYAVSTYGAVALRLHERARRPAAERGAAKPRADCTAAPRAV